jgi:hypothetical protein
MSEAPTGSAMRRALLHHNRRKPEVRHLESTMAKNATALPYIKTAR